MPARRGWTRPDDVRDAVLREWSSGRLLRARVEVRELPEVPLPVATAFPLRVPLRGPTSTDLVTRFDDVRAWAASFESPRGYRVETQERASRPLGRQTLPVAAILDTERDALALIGRTGDAARFDSLVAQTPVPMRWFAAAHPLKVLEIAPDWPGVLAVADWLRSNPRPGIYVRQVDLAGVHTKLVERHRHTIAALVDGGRPHARVGSLAAFESAYGFRSRPKRLRFRAVDPTCSPVPGMVDVTLPVEEVDALAPRLRRVVVVENEVSMLAFPAMADTVVVWGSGNQAPELLGAVGWLQGVDLHYWGDLDTHGYAILDRLRQVLPHTRSLLMDEATLLAHRDRWGNEAEPTKRDLPHLSDAEAQVYGALCTDRWGSRVRLEQELIRFGAVRAAAEALLDQP